MELGSSKSKASRSNNESWDFLLKESGGASAFTVHGRELVLRFDWETRSDVEVPMVTQYASGGVRNVNTNVTTKSMSMFACIIPGVVTC